jgi:hypothetical protein
VRSTVTDRDAYLKTWEPDNTVPYPRDVWVAEFPAPEAAYPAVDFLPIDLSVVYTAYLEGARFDLYTRIDLDMGREGTLALVVIGAVPAERDDMLFCLDTGTGQVLLLGPDDGTLELVNTTFKAFAAFLYEFSLFIDADTGAPGRAARAKTLRATLNGIDRKALKDRESWWSVALMQLESAGALRPLRGELVEDHGPPGSFREGVGVDAFEDVSEDGGAGGAALLAFVGVDELLEVVEELDEAAVVGVDRLDVARVGLVELDDVTGRWVERVEEVLVVLNGADDDEAHVDRAVFSAEADGVVEVDPAGEVGGVDDLDVERDFVALGEGRGREAGREPVFARVGDPLVFGPQCLVLGRRGHVCLLGLGVRSERSESIGPQSKPRSSMRSRQASSSSSSGVG